MIDPQDAIQFLPDWLKAGASAALFLLACVATVLGIRQGKGRAEHGGEEREGHDVIGPGPVKDLVSAFNSMAESLSRIVELLDSAAEDRRLDEKIRLRDLEKARG